MDSNLILVNTQASPPILLDNCPVVEEIDIPLVLKVSDINTPGDVDGSFSHSGLMPGTPELDRFLEDILDVNVSLQKFNPNLKIKAYLLHDGIEVFDGHLQILSIKVDEVKKQHFYEFNLIGESMTFMTKIKNLLVESLDFSSYNHTLSYANIVASWASAIGSGYKYGLADYGLNNSDLNDVRPEHLKPQIHVREVLLKIFQAQGYTWTSAYLDGNDFKRKVMPPTETITVSQTVLNNNKFLAEAAGTQLEFIGSTSAITYTTPFSTVGNYILYNSTNVHIVEFPNEDNDAGNIYNNATFNLTVPVTNKYNIQANIGLEFNVYRDTGGGPIDVSNNMICDQSSGIHIVVYNSSQSQIEGIYDLDVLNGIFGTANQFNGTVILNNVQLTAGDIYYIGVRYSSLKLKYNALSSGANWSIRTKVVLGSNFSAEFASSSVYEGATVVMNTLLPVNKKQSEFVTDICKQFHLMVKPNKDKPNDLIIEPEPNFHSTIPIDWDGKHDKDTGVQVVPMGDLDFNKLTIKYSEDGDYYNKLYQDEYKEPYGTYSQIIQNDFIKNEYVIQPSFAATPYVLNEPTGVVLPSIIKKDNNTIGGFKSKLRILHWSGVINLPVGVSWKFVHNNGASVVTYITMPQAGHTDNPWNPTLDMSWGVPNRVYFNYPNQTWTNNNQFNIYYSNRVNQITHKDSKKYITGFNLTPDDIHTFDFQRPIFTTIRDQQGTFRVNKIHYNPRVNPISKVELLLLAPVPAFSPIELDTSGFGGPFNFSSNVFNQNITSGPNTNYGKESFISGGNGNMIPAGSENVALINSENVIPVGTENFLGVGLDKNSEIESDSANLFDSLKVNGDGIQKEKPSFITVNSDFEIDGQYTLYYIDTSIYGFAINGVWNATLFPGLKITFKLIDNSGGSFTLTEGSSPPGTIDNAPSLVLSTTNEKETVHSNGSTLFTI